MNLLNNKKHMLLLGLLFMAMVTLPMTLFVLQKNQEQRSRAAATTSLYLTPSSSIPSPVRKNPGEQVSFDVMINPGSNLPSTVKLELQFDPAILGAVGSLFTINSTAFPTVLEGPNLTTGNYIVSLSIGADPTKAIQTTTKVGTITFTAISPTASSPTAISFGSRTQVLSIASSDQANENVLSSSEPGYVEVIAPPTSMPTQEPSVTAVLTSTSVPPTPTETPTSTPGATIIATPSAQAASTSLSLNLYLHSIGTSGDNSNSGDSSMSNKNPLHPNRNVTVFIYDINNQLVSTAAGTVAYNTSGGNFLGKIPLTQDIPTGQYTVKVKETTHLRKLVPGIMMLTSKIENDIPAIPVIAGDVNDDNTLNILDFSLIAQCYSDLLPAASCTDEMKVKTDLNDDGSVNQVDYNLFMREMTVQSGN